MPATTVRPLADRPEALPELVALLEGAWPEWYGPAGPGNATQDLREACQRETLPLALVALAGDRPVGLCVLRARSLDACPNWGPWATAGLVAPEARGQGHGKALLRAACDVAARLGHPWAYCATDGVEGLLRAEGWAQVGEAEAHGAQLAVFRKATGAAEGP